MRRCVFVLAVVCVAGCRPPEPPSDAGPLPSPPAEKPHADAATGPEQVVLAWLKDHANDPQSLEISRWGPDDERGEVKKALAALQAATSQQLMVWKYAAIRDMDQVVRVRFRSKNDLGALQVQDILCGIKAGKVQGVLPNKNEDEWKEKALEEIKAAASFVAPGGDDTGDRPPPVPKGKSTPPKNPADEK